MDAVYLTLFVSSVLGVLGVVLFVWTHREGSRDHTLRLALMPLDDDTSHDRAASAAIQSAPTAPSTPTGPSGPAIIPQSDTEDRP